MSTILSQMKLFQNLLRLLEYAELDGNFITLATALDSMTAQAVWGSISGTLADQTDLQAALTALQSAVTAAQTTANAAAPKASPALTGTPTAPTAASGTNTAQIATTAFVQAAAVPFASGAEAIAGTEAAKTITPATLRNGLNASGSAPIYACRAWVDFNGTGTVAIRASGNVSSITDNGTGSYTVNFSAAMPDTSYASVALGGGTSGVRHLAHYDDTVARTVSSVTFISLDTNHAAADCAFICAAIFR